MTDSSRHVLESFTNPHSGRSYTIEHQIHEFTSLCPITGQPDFGTMRIRYVADQLCIELKSLKLYLQGFRNNGIFYEDITNVILDDLIDTCKPRWIEVRSTWSIRGGIHSTITAQHGDESINKVNE